MEGSGAGETRVGGGPVKLKLNQKKESSKKVVIKENDSESDVSCGSDDGRNHN